MHKHILWMLEYEVAARALHVIADVRMFSKEPYIVPNEPYVVPTEPCVVPGRCASAARDRWCSWGLSPNCCTSSTCLRCAHLVWNSSHPLWHSCCMKCPTHRNPPILKSWSQSLPAGQLREPHSWFRRRSAVFRSRPPSTLSQVRAETIGAAACAVHMWVLHIYIVTGEYQRRSLSLMNIDDSPWQGHYIVSLSGLSCRQRTRVDRQRTHDIMSLSG